MLNLDLLKPFCNEVFFSGFTLKYDFFAYILKTMSAVNLNFLNKFTYQLYRKESMRQLHFLLNFTQKS